jgi:hypothetical protein
MNQIKPDVHIESNFATARVYILLDESNYRSEDQHVLGLRFDKNPIAVATSNLIQHIIVARHITKYAAMREFKAKPLRKFLGPNPQPIVKLWMERIRACKDEDEYNQVNAELKRSFEVAKEVFIMLYVKNGAKRVKEEDKERCIIDVMFNGDRMICGGIKFARIPDDFIIE